MWGILGWVLVKDADLYADDGRLTDWDLGLGDVTGGRVSKKLSGVGLLR